MNCDNRPGNDCSDASLTISCGRGPGAGSFSFLGRLVGPSGTTRQLTFEKSDNEILNREFEFSAPDADLPVQVRVDTNVDLLR